MHHALCSQSNLKSPRPHIDPMSNQSTALDGTVARLTYRDYVYLFRNSLRFAHEVSSRKYLHS
ncbi:Hypothetical protein HEAR0025 [Herminiimonas arsenicoxydans]|uniref:Uncharacterized protein n=1 Tax=Herminiimonas arsenicoxydans TaxID=204773 RepID=A4G174_HERAR|nr:Hypothetical protein HEAR0025 [Herminiimonas arsenicoxydans]